MVRIFIRRARRGSRLLCLLWLFRYRLSAGLGILSRLRRGLLSHGLVPKIPSSTPADPARLVRSPHQHQKQGRAHQADAQGATAHPAAVGVQIVTDGRAKELAAKGQDHVDRVDGVLGRGVDVGKGHAVGDDNGVHAQVAEEGPDDGAGERKGADKGADQHRGQGHEDGNDLRSARMDARSQKFGDNGIEAHGRDTDEGKQSNGQGRQVEWVTRQLKSQGGPKRREHAHCAKGNEAALRQDGVLEWHLDNGEQRPVVRAARAEHGVVGHVQEEEGVDGNLQAKRHPVDTAPRAVLRNDTGEQTRNQNSKEETRHDYGNHGRSVSLGRVLHD